MARDIFQRTLDCLLQTSPDQKVAGTLQLFQDAPESPVEPSTSEVRSLEQAGLPPQLRLVNPDALPRRGIGSTEGRVALLHSLAHIEFNAINLALDAVYRFRQMPVEFRMDWLRVAADEAIHFSLLRKRMLEMDVDYGDFDAHDGLWTMARRTDHDVLVRMALVPRVLEARGLDVAPPMIEKLKQAGDDASAAILQRIYTDEIEHVKIGNHWFHTVCQQRDVEPTDVFAELLREHTSNVLRGPYNTIARVQAGFSEEEIEAIEQIELEFRQS